MLYKNSGKANQNFSMDNSIFENSEEKKDYVNELQYKNNSSAKNEDRM